MTRHRLHRVSCVASCAVVLLFSWATAARAQVDAASLSQDEALSAAAKASPKLAKGLAKELGSTPEQAAGTAGVIFGIAKSLLKPEDFAEVSKVVPGMDALLAAVPSGVIGAPGAQATGLGPTPGLAPTPGFAPTTGFATSPPSTPEMSAAPVGGLSWSVADLAKMGIKPDMIMKAVPYLSGYLKKHGGAALGSLLGGLFKIGK